MSDTPAPKTPSGHAAEPKNFEPKTYVKLNPPKNDPITVEELAKCDGMSSQIITFLPSSLPPCSQQRSTDPSKPTLVAIKGTVFDVSKNKAYGTEGQYHVFAGRDPSRALATSSLKKEDCTPDWQDLEEKEKTVLEEWFTFFSKRYDIVGRVVRGSGNGGLGEEEGVRG